MISTQYAWKIIIGGLLAGVLAFGGLYAWNAEQGVAGGSSGGDVGGSPKIATIGADREMTDRD